MMVLGVGIAAVPFAVPIVLLGNSLSRPARFLVDQIFKGAAKTSALAVGRLE
jgi:hypothetical protein